MTPSPNLPPLPLPPSITSRIIPTASLSFHILESGYTPDHSRPLILLLHGFPEIAYSWRKVLPRLADAGYYVVAPDQRGFGRTTGWDTRSYDEVDLSSFSLTSLVRDLVILVHALGYRSVRCVAGHDAGAVSAALCALLRPDLFHSVVLMSHPFNGTPALPFNTANQPQPQIQDPAPPTQKPSGTESTTPGTVHDELAAQNRKHYKWYYSTAPANQDMTTFATPSGLHDFLRGYFYLKSGSWKGNHPRRLAAWSAPELLQLPYYYVMPGDATMPEAVALDMAGESDVDVERSRAWLPDAELAVFAAEYARTGFQGGLNWYRVGTTAGGRYTRDFETFAGKKIEVPSAFVSGALDWGNYQEPGALEKMVDGVSCSDFRRLRLVDGVGHWTPQEAPGEVVEVILELVRDVSN